MTEKDFVPTGLLSNNINGQVIWRAPSNIALIKYWGKFEDQIPANASLSLTLDVCASTTKLTYNQLDTKGADFSFEIFLDDAPIPEFAPKVSTFFKRIDKYLPFLKEYHLEIRTSNTFPHSSGIASSASGMAALALCLMDIEKAKNPDMTPEYFFNKASFLARLGSGSACRSIRGAIVQWGAHEGIKSGSNLFGTTYPFKVHAVFSNYQDSILLVHQGQKQVSSTVGHSLMNGHFFAERRFEQAANNMVLLKAILEKGDLDGFIELVESEALTLHAMMMTSIPYFVLMKANTLKIIEKIWAFRNATGLHPCFTLDAGANVHLLYPLEEQDQISSFIEEELLMHCEARQYIQDSNGQGAIKIE